MMSLDGFARRLREERLSKALNQADFAALGGVKITAQQQYEGGKTTPNVDYLYRLAGHGVDIGYMLLGVRADGTLGFGDTMLLQAFAKLSEREREATMAFITG